MNSTGISAIASIEVSSQWKTFLKIWGSESLRWKEMGLKTGQCITDNIMAKLWERKHRITHTRI